MQKTTEAAWKHLLCDMKVVQFAQNEAAKISRNIIYRQKKQ